MNNVFGRNKGRARNALDRSDARVKDWQLISGVLLFILIAQMVISAVRQNDITVHIPPDLSAGAQFDSNTIPKPNVYLFASEVVRSINYWKTNGDKEMPDNLNRYACYISENVKSEQIALHALRVSDGQSANRTRRLSEITDLKDVEGSVSSVGAGIWDVDLDLRLIESLEGTQVKDHALRYRVRVAADNSGSVCNPFNMRITAINQPLRIEFEGGEE